MPPALKPRQRFRSIVAGLESRHASARGPETAKSAKRRSLPGGWHNWALGLLCLVILVIAITSIGSSSSGASSEQRTAEVGRGVVQSTVSGNGSLEAAEQVELNFGASGEVTEIYVEAGEKVNKNEILARVDSSSARASLASAEAQLAEAEETLEGAEEAEVSTTYDSSDRTVLASYEGGGEETSTVLLAAVEGGAQPEESTETEKEPGSEKAGSGEEKTGSADGKSGSKEGSGEPTTPDSGGQEPQEAPEEEAAPTQEAAPTEAAPESSGGAPSGEGAESASPAATVSVATAEANLRQAELSVQSAEQEVSETALRAPFSGTVASISGSVGETVSGEGSSGASSPSSGSSEASTGGLALGGGGGSSTGSGESSSSAFIVLTQLDRLKMEVSFSEADIGKVEVGQPATVSISSIEGTELAGRVTKVDVLPSEGSSGGVVEYPATILLTQRAKGLRAGMSASAEVVVEQVANAVTVPSEAIASEPSKTVTVDENGREVQKSVETGLIGDESTEILSGLKPGETLVLPEASIPTGGMEAGGGEGGLPSFGGGGGLPSFGGGGPPSGFPGGP